MSTQLVSADAAVARLLSLREQRQHVPSEMVRFVAGLVDRDERTVYRWLRQGHAPRNERPRFRLTEQDRMLYALHHGNAVRVHEELHAGRAGAPSLRTLQRAFETELSDADRALVRTGVAARRRNELNLVSQTEHRNQAWGMDHTQLNCLVMPTRGTHPQRPWATLFVDLHCSAIMGWALSLQPTHATVLAGLHRAVLPKFDDQPFCGCPERLQSDNGLEFTADAVTDAISFLGGRAETVRGYSPHLNGVVERVNRTMDTTWLASTAFYSDASRQHDGSHVRPDGFLPPLFDEFVTDFARWVYRYNCELPHSGLDGRTPLQAWQDDATALEVPQEGEIRWMMQAPVKRKVGPYGIELGGLHYVHPTALHGLRGRSVDVRHPLHETAYIDVCVGEEHLCRATPQETWTEEERLAFMKGRQLSRSKMKKARREATQELARRMEANGYERGSMDFDSNGASSKGDADLGPEPTNSVELLQLEVDDDAI